MFVQGNENIEPITLGIHSAEALEMYREHKNQLDTIELYQQVYNSLSSEGMGGTLNLYILTNENIDYHEFKIIDSKPIEYSVNNNLLVHYVGAGGISIDPSATISWNQVTNQPAIPTIPSYITSTKITSTSIESPNIVGGTIRGGSIESDSTINVTTDARVGNKLHLSNTNFGNGIMWDDMAEIYIDPAGKDLIISANKFGAGNAIDIYGENIRFHGNVTGVVAVFG